MAASVILEDSLIFILLIVTITDCLVLLPRIINWNSLEIFLAEKVLLDAAFYLFYFKLKDR